MLITSKQDRNLHLMCSERCALELYQLSNLTLPLSPMYMYTVHECRVLCFRQIRVEISFECLKRECSQNSIVSRTSSISAMEYVIVVAIRKRPVQKLWRRCPRSFSSIIDICIHLPTSDSINLDSTSKSSDYNPISNPYPSDKVCNALSELALHCRWLILLLNSLWGELRYGGKSFS